MAKSNITQPVIVLRFCGSHLIRAFKSIKYLKTGDLLVYRDWLFVYEKPYYKFVEVKKSV